MLNSNKVKQLTNLNKVKYKLNKVFNKVKKKTSVDIFTELTRDVF